MPAFLWLITDVQSVRPANHLLLQNGIYIGTRKKKVSTQCHARGQREPCDAAREVYTAAALVPSLPYAVCVLRHCASRKAHDARAAAHGQSHGPVRQRMAVSAASLGRCRVDGFESTVPPFSYPAHIPLSLSPPCSPPSTLVCWKFQTTLSAPSTRPTTTRGSCAPTARRPGFRTETFLTFTSAAPAAR